MNRVLSLIVLGAAALLMALALSSCTAVRQIISKDIHAFHELAREYGTIPDQTCAKLLGDNWEKMNALLDDERGAAIALLYRTVLVNRMARRAEMDVTEQCGQLAAELAVMMGSIGARR
jgi:hypothetical protein